MPSYSSLDNYVRNIFHQSYGVIGITPIEARGTDNVGIMCSLNTKKLHAQPGFVIITREDMYDNTQPSDFIRRYTWSDKGLTKNFIHMMWVSLQAYQHENDKELLSLLHDIIGKITRSYNIWENDKLSSSILVDMDKKNAWFDYAVKSGIIPSHLL